MAKARVLVVDDSAFMRKVISDMIANDEMFEVIGTARDGIDALDKIDRLRPDLVTLDVEMPRKDGLATLKEIMASRPLPVIMLSSVTRAGAQATIEALALGAVDFVEKPSGSISLDIADIEQELLSKLKAAVQARVQLARAPRPTRWSALIRPRSRAVPPVPGDFPASAAKTVIIVGASTGGPKALEEVIRRFPPDLPAGVLIVQHMPAGFTKSMAERLDNIAAIHVKEAEDGELLSSGIAYVAPGSFHLIVSPEQRLRLDQGPPVNYVRPSIDVTMLTLPPMYASRIIGVILTGMGKDGAQGMAAIKEAGGVTIVQNEQTSTIFSMPRAVVDSGNADFILPLEHIGEAAVRAVEQWRRLSKG